VADGNAVRVKVCGLTRREDVLVADGAGVDYLGVIASAGFGRSVEPTAARVLLEGTRARKVAVLVDESADGAVAAGRALGADVLQLHGDEPPEVLAALRERGPWKLWKAVRARSLADIEQAVSRYGALVDGLLVEGWKDALGAGGARVTLDPARVRALVPAGVTFVLAGGLTPDKVTEAVRAFHPDVVDVSSGVERALGVKDHEKVRGFIDGARGGLASMSGAKR